jgi:hypothetical protein
MTKQIPAEPEDLTSIDDAKLGAVFSDEEFQTMFEFELPPAKIRNETLRAAYLAFLQRNGYDVPM